ncbi:hypothetical protein BH09ACT8_BH09ACT8_57940 [soil metagenome]
MRWRATPRHDCLQNSKIGEVVIQGRRGVRHAAFSVGEFLALGHLNGVEVIIEGGDDFAASPADDVETVLKRDIAREYAARTPTRAHKRIMFRFLASPVELVGESRVEALSVVRNSTDDGGGLVPGEPGDTELIETSLVLRSIGYRGAAIKGLPYDAGTGAIPNDNGRVVGEDHLPIPGVYVAGWIKRGPRGMIGTNRTCVEETVGSLLVDISSMIAEAQVKP